jgi:predicted dinucleotide-binding enzyme
VRQVLLVGRGAVGVAAYRRLRAEGAAVTVVAPPGDYLAGVAEGDGALASSTLAARGSLEIVVADGPWPCG